MSDFDRPGATLQGPEKQRQRGSRFANLGDRLARTFGTVERDPGATQGWDPPEGFGYGDDGEPPDRVRVVLRGGMVVLLAVGQLAERNNINFPPVSSDWLPARTLFGNTGDAVFTLRSL